MVFVSFDSRVNVLFRTAVYSIHFTGNCSDDEVFTFKCEEIQLQVYQS